MFTIRRASNIGCINNLSVNANHQAAHRQPMVTLIIGSAVMIGLTGCGQKGELYLADTSSQTVINSSDVLDSTSNPQDAAFKNVDDDNYQSTRYLEQKQVLPEVSDDPNDY